jgi:hypothetical protein
MSEEEIPKWRKIKDAKRWLYTYLESGDEADILLNHMHEIEGKLKKAKADSKALDQVCHFVKTTLYRDVWVNDEPTEYQKGYDRAFKLMEEFLITLGVVEVVGEGEEPEP